MNTTYETAGMIEKAMGKAHQWAARAVLKSQFFLPESFRGVTFCFDDFPQSAGDYGAKTLEDAGARAVFYTCFGLLGQQSYGGPLAELDQVIALARRDHDIGCHTYDHLNCSFVSADKVERSCNDNIEAAQAKQITLRHFSYPQGGMSMATKKIVRRHYQTARSGFQGINNGECDAHCLKSMPLYESSSASVHTLMEQVSDNGGWLMLYTHDVAEAPSQHGVSRKTFYEVVAHCMQLQLQVRTLHQMNPYLAA